MTLQPQHRPGTTPTARSGNRFLAALTRAERGLLAGALHPIELTFGMTLLVPGRHIRSIVFPDEGLVSLLAELPDGDRTEVGMVGREGLVGLSALLSEPTSQIRAVVRVPGRGQQVDVASLLPLADGSRNLRDLVRRHAMSALAGSSLTAACNTFHGLEPRTARWLLSAADRVGPGFPINQDDLATILGARRPTMNTVLRDLRNVGLVQYTRGRIAIADRGGLEAKACSCYRTGRLAFERAWSQGGLV